MLPPQYRLRHSDDFTRAVKSRRRAGARTLVIHLSVPPVLSDQEEDPTEPRRCPARVGLVVSKAVGGSVVRSTVKRRLRHAVADLVPSLPDGSLVVVRANPTAAAASFGELHEDLSRCLRRAMADDGVAPRRRERRS